jgi:hypothetical protein
MLIQDPHFQKKRQFERIEIPESTLCKIYVLQSQELWESLIKIKNISLGGIYFVCDENPPFKKDDIRHIILDALQNDQKLYRLEFHGLVVRTENCGSQFGVAVKFLSEPIYYRMNENNHGDILRFDKTRILYQHFQLFKKAYEIIMRTPEIRSEMVLNIKKRIDQDLYKTHTKDVVQAFNNIL